MLLDLSEVLYPPSKFRCKGLWHGPKKCTCWMPSSSEHIHSLSTWAVAAQDCPGRGLVSGRDASDTGMSSRGGAARLTAAWLLLRTAAGKIADRRPKCKPLNATVMYGRQSLKASDLTTAASTASFR